MATILSSLGDGRPVLLLLWYYHIPGYVETKRDRLEQSVMCGKFFGSNFLIRSESFVTEVAEPETDYEMFKIHMQGSTFEQAVFRIEIE